MGKQYLQQLLQFYKNKLKKNAVLVHNRKTIGNY